MGTLDDALLAGSITSVFDVLLNLTPPPVGAVLTRTYFRKHTPLSAALIAGFIGFFTFFAIFPFTDTGIFGAHSVAVTFLVSALIGFPMEWSGLFPHLQTEYYDKLPRLQSFMADGLSGLVVAAVFWYVRGRLNGSDVAVIGGGSVLLLLVYLHLVRRGIIVYSNP